MVHTTVEGEKVVDGALHFHLLVDFPVTVVSLYLVVGVVEVLTLLVKKGVLTHIRLRQLVLDIFNVVLIRLPYLTSQLIPSSPIRDPLRQQRLAMLLHRSFMHILA